MAKSVKIAPEIEAKILANTGEQIDTSTITVFETVAASTRPISKRGSIFDKARATKQMLEAMANFVNVDKGFVPMHTHHLQAEEMPIGRVFAAQVVQTLDGSYDLLAMFYLPNTETDFINKINLGVIDEVSIGAASQKMLCNKCGFDFRGESASFEHLWSHTCENGHVMGEDGAYLILDGLERWMELSLVSKGASNNAKILGRTKQVMGKEAYDRLAASGVAPEAVILFSTVSRSNSMEIEKLIGDLTDLKAAAIQKDSKITELTTVNASLTTEVSTLKGKVTEVEAQLTASETKATEASNKLAEVEAKLTAAEAKATELQTKLDLKLGGAGAGGTSDDAVGDAGKAGDVLRASAFKTRK